MKVKVKSLSRVRLFATPWTVAYQASPSMGFSRQEYWSGCHFPSPGDLPYWGIEPGSPAFQADALTSELPGKPWWFESPITNLLNAYSLVWLRLLCPTLCNLMDCSLPGFSLHGILQARVLEWVAISFSRGSSWPRDRTQVSCIPGRRFNLWATRETQVANILEL